MDSTPFSKKVEILGDYFSIFVDGDEESNQFTSEYKDTLWICLAANVKYVTIEERFHFFVEDAWKGFCEYLQVDPYGNYENATSMLGFAYE